METNGTRIPAQAGNGSPPVSGPFETNREAQAAAVAAIPPRQDWSILSAEQNRQLLTQACEQAGITLGAYDRRILDWLAGYEDSTCAVIAGLITRAHAGQAPALTDAQRATVLVALADAETYVTERAAAWCDACGSAPGGACHEHVDDLDQADRYRQLAREVGGGAR